jgi:galactokinase
MNLQTRRSEVSARFREIFAQEPVIWGRAPGRVDLMGSHTDYNMGYVMTMTIDRDTWIAAVPRQDRQVVIYSMNAKGGGAFDLDQIEHDPESPWTDYLRGMAHVLEGGGYSLTGFNGLVHSTVPIQSGLSSSAAIAMATGVVFQQAGGFHVDPVQMALLGQKAENQFVGVNCGVLDQYSSAMGKAGSSLLLDCRHLTSKLSPIAEGIQVVICDTGAKRTLAGSEYGERRAQCEEGARILSHFYPGIEALRDVRMEQFERHRDALPEGVSRRCQFVIQENQRVLDLADALSTGRRERLRELYLASYSGARDLYEITIPTMEAMMSVMMSAPGAIAARQAGAGFGGCMVALVEQDQMYAFCASVMQRYQTHTGIEPVVFPVEAAPGAGTIDF